MDKETLDKATLDKATIEAMLKEEDTYWLYYLLLQVDWGKHVCSEIKFEDE